MKIAIVSDVHGNYPALQAVLNDAEKNKVDCFIFAGDYIFDLPYSTEVTDTIQVLNNAFVIKGNKEGYLKSMLTEDQSNWNIDQVGVMHQTFRELSGENIQYLDCLPESCIVELPFHGRVFTTHFLQELGGGKKRTGFSSGKFKKDMKEHPFTHEQFIDEIAQVLNEEENQEILLKIDATVVVVGHSHLQWHIYSGDKVMINPGSCGMPLDGKTDAAYTILHDTETGLVVEEKRVAYDIQSIIAYAKTKESYKKGKIWSELIFLNLQTGLDHGKEFFALASEVAKEKGEMGGLYSNETWLQTGERYFMRVHV